MEYEEAEGPIHPKIASVPPAPRQPECQAEKMPLAENLEGLNFAQDWPGAAVFTQACGQQNVPQMDLWVCCGQRGST